MISLFCLRLYILTLNFMRAAKDCTSVESPVRPSRMLSWILKTFYMFIAIVVIWTPKRLSHARETQFLPARATMDPKNDILKV